jgi:hypothetical protein
MAPILDGLGLILVVVSYHGRISIGISSCRQIVPDPDNMAECFALSMDELELAVTKADPLKLKKDDQDYEIAPTENQHPLKAFRDANEALDKAIDSLED